MATLSSIIDAAVTRRTDLMLTMSTPSLQNALRRARLAVVTYAPAVADMGPLLIVARDYYDNGVETAKIAARVMRGERTADIPFSAVPKINDIVNLKVAGDYGLHVPPDLVARAARVIR
jgi:putative ABC transport system substrate-binding protein